jgi:hypothetical protein
MISVERYYEQQLIRALDSGMPDAEAHTRAQDATDRYYWEMVDRSREEAKDRDAGLLQRD